MADSNDLALAQQRLDQLRHCAVLGLRMRDIGDGNKVSIALPYSDAIIGDPSTGVIAGGALTTLLDTTCGAAVSRTADQNGYTLTLDLRIDYMGPAVPGREVTGMAEVYRISRHVVFTRATAYQDPNYPIAHCAAAFMRLSADNNAQPPVLDPLPPHVRILDALPEIALRIPYISLIGVECLPIGDQFIFKLPPKDDNLGNPNLPALHGGVIGGFMECAASMHLMLITGKQRIPKIIDFSLDYLRPGRRVDCFCQCRIVRQGRKIANVSIECWQSTQDQPIAVARAHFLLADGE